MTDRLDKVVYRDADFVKVLRGSVIKDDGDFLVFECDNDMYSLNKKDIVSVRTAKEGGDKDGRNQRF